MALQKLVVIDDGRLSALSASAKFVKEFPFLASIRSPERKKSGCGRCGTRSVNLSDTFKAIKQAVAGLDTTKKQLLKEMLNAHRVRVLYKDRSGKAVEVTF